MVKITSFLCGLWLLAFVNIAEGSEAKVKQTLQNVVADYHQGFIKSQPEKTLDSLSRSFFMANGNFSGDPQQWQAHLYLHGDDIKTWVRGMIKMAGPHKNQLSFSNIDIRGDSALVVTKETGSNKFRQWQDEVVVYSLGKVQGRWKIVSLFIRDIKNP